MRWARPRLVPLILLTCPLLFLAPLSASEAGHWPGFRGPGARGVAEGHPAPVSWDLETGTNVAWKTEIPGLGLSSPAVWGDHVFVTTAVGKKADPKLKVGLYGDITPVKDEGTIRFEVHAVDRRTGKVLWTRTAHEGVPKIRRHPKSSHANPTPATDGERVIALFGSEGLYAYDMDGELLWKKDLGTLDSAFYLAPEAQWGFGSSPLIHDGKVIVQADVLEGSFLAAYDVRDGREIWRTAREDVPTWSTPTVHGSQVLVNGWKHIGGYDLATGKEIWRMQGGGDIPVPTPYVVDDLIYLTSAHGGGRPVYAVRTSARGDITLAAEETSNEHVAWSDPRGGAYMPTSLVYRGLIYILRGNGTFSARAAPLLEEVHFCARSSVG